VKVVRLSALHTCPLSPRKYSWYSFLLEDVSIISMKNSNNNIGNQFRDLLVGSAGPQTLGHRVHLIVTVID
jgi:hypothetical protein